MDLNTSRSSFGHAAPSWPTARERREERGEGDLVSRRTFTKLRRLGGVFAIAALIGACDSNTSDQRDSDSKQSSATQSDTALLSDLSNAEAEFLRRLRARVTIQDGMLLIYDPLATGVSSMYGLPPSTPWSISCGFFGLQVTFGAGSAEQGGIIDVELTQSYVREEQCRRLIPRIGREISVIVDAR